MASSASGDLGFIPMQKKDCLFYVAFGRCSYGQNCRFNHPPRDDSKVVREVRIESSYENYTGKSPCKFYLAGYCKYGSYCDFYHSMPDPPLQYNSVGLPMRLGVAVCSFYKSNLWCGYGAGCKFDHPELQYVIPQEYGYHGSGQALQYTVPQQYGSQNSGQALQYAILQEYGSHDSSQALQYAIPQEYGSHDSGQALQYAIPQEYGSRDSGQALQYAIPQEYGSHDSGLAQEYDGGLVGTSDGGSLPICATSSPHQMSDYGN